MTDCSKTPIRMCVSCRKTLPKEALIKVSKSKTGVFVVGGAAEGRGAYICKSAECMAKCKKQRTLNRTFRSEVPAEVYGKAEELIESR